MNNNEDTVFEWTVHQTRVMKCKECGNEVNVNINYQIPSVTCNECWRATNKEMNNM